MRIKTFIASAFAAFVVVGAIAGCSDKSTSATTTSAAPMSASAETSMAPMSSTAAAHGAFAGLNDKKVSGTATLTAGKVELSGFSSDEGPDLHLYLAKGTSESDVSNGVALGKVAYDKASQSFEVPTGVDAAAYSDVVVHCDKAKAVFGAAELMK